MSKSYTILLADDDPEILALFEYILAPLTQVRLETVTDGSEAITRCKEVQPDLILLDHEMPGLDGFSACQVIRRMYPNPNCEIWFVTGRAMESDLPMAQEAGATCIIPKPFDPNKMRNRIAQALGIELPS